MSRKYHLYHLSDEEKAERIKQRILEVDGVKDIEISDDLTVLDIDADIENITMVMDRVVNICSKVSLGCEVSYMF